MNKLYLIIIDPSIDSDVVKQRITKQGNYYILYKNQYFLIANFQSAKDVYEAICDNDNTIGIVVLELNKFEMTYWGYSDKGLWEWLVNNKIGKGNQ